MRTLITCLLGIALFISPDYSRAAEISQFAWPGDDQRPFGVYLKGEIVRGDYDKLRLALKDYGILHFFITSRGGNIAEAIRIGRFVRSSLTSVTAIGECWSACALILAGVVNPKRMGLSLYPTKAQANIDYRVVALHRPYLNPELARELDFDAVEKVQQQILEETKKYLLEMGVENWVYEKMITKSSQDAWLLENSEVREIFKGSVAYEEWILAKCGGLSESENLDRLLIVYSTSVLFEAGNDPELDQWHLDYLNENYGNNWRKKYDSLSSGYKTYLAEKTSELGKCIRQAKNERQKEVLDNI